MRLTIGHVRDKSLGNGNVFVEGIGVTNAEEGRITVEFGIYREARFEKNLIEEE